MQRIGYMIYETAEVEKNRGFVSMFAQAGKAYGLRFCLVTKDQYKTSPLPDFVINRTRDPEVSLFYDVMEFWYFILVISFIPGMIKR